MTKILKTAAAVVLAAATSAAQQPQTTPGSQRQAPTFRVEVNYVEIDVTVADAEGRFVRGLTKDDFELIEEGEQQTISAFSVVDLPVVRVEPPPFRGTPIEPDVRTNIGEFDGRIILIVIDDLQIDARRTPLVRAAARQFVRRFVGGNDLAAVVTTGGSRSSMQDFTNSQSRLLAAIDRFIGQKARRDDPTMTMPMERTMRQGTVAGDIEKATKAQNSLRTLAGTADFLSKLRGRRKAVVWFSEGVDYDINDIINRPYATAIRDDMSAAIGAATRAGVSFYAVDARGVGAGLDEAIELTGVNQDYQSDTGMQQVFNETRRAQNFLHSVSEQTGGFAVVNRNDLNTAFSKIIQENSSYYLLGYYPTNDRRDGKFRKVFVRVKRPGVQVKYRQGYIAPKGKRAASETPATAASAPPELRAALESPVPVSGLGMRVFAAPFAYGKKSALAIVVEFDPARLRFEPGEKGTQGEHLELIIVPVNASGKPLEGVRDQAPLRLGARSYESVKANGLRMMRRLDLSPGRYQLRIAAKASNGNAVGGLLYDVDVPDFSKPALAMSGLTLMSSSSARILTPPPDESLLEILPIVATAMRDFPAGDTLRAYVEVYDNKAGTPHAVEIRTTVTGDDGKVMFGGTDQRRTDELKGKSRAFGLTADISLSGYPKGRYVLRVEARALMSGGASTSRELEFRVR